MIEGENAGEGWKQGRMYMAGVQGSGEASKEAESCDEKRKEEPPLGRPGGQCPDRKCRVSQGAKAGWRLVCAVRREGPCGGRDGGDEAGEAGRTLSHVVPWPQEGACILFWLLWKGRRAGRRVVSILSF